MVRSGEEVMMSISNVHLHQKFSEAAREVAEKVKIIKLAVKRVPPGAIGEYLAVSILVIIKYLRFILFF